MKTAFKLLLLSIFFVSCGEADTAIYNGDSSNQTLLSFSEDFYSLPIVIDAEGSVDVIVNSSTMSDVDRTFSVTVVEEETVADPTTYDVPATVTIPAGEFQGVLTITGQDLGLVEVEPKDLVIRVDAPEDAIFKDDTTVVRVGQVCPIGENAFVGAYLMEQLTPDNPADGVPVFPEAVVNIVKTSPTARRFDAVFLGDLEIGQPASTIPFNLACGNVNMTAASVSTFLICNTGAPTILLGPGAVPGAYDTSGDDSEFTLTIAEYINGTGGACGSGTYEVTFKFTKQ